MPRTPAPLEAPTGHPLNQEQYAFLRLVGTVGFGGGPDGWGGLRMARSRHCGNRALWEGSRVTNCH